MSAVSIRAALETALNAITPAIATSFENAPFTKPAVQIPFQECLILFASPNNIVYGSSHIEVGFMQVNLMYPLQAGSAAAQARAELIRSTFIRGASFTSGAVTVNINKTPEITPAQVDGERFVIPVRVPFYSNIN